MKKYLFIMPLMVLSLLASCGGKTPEPIKETIKFTFNGTYCTAERKSEYSWTKEYTKGETIVISVKADETYILSKDKVSVTDFKIEDVDFERFPYDEKSMEGVLYFKNPVNDFTCAISAVAPPNII